LDSESSQLHGAQKKNTSMESAPIRTSVCIVGAGPAGATLGLLLARAGISVILLEKHEDFLRDFRGDTVHPYTLEILDQVGLCQRFHELPHRKVQTFSFVQDGIRVEVADFRKIKVRFPYVAFLPQWDFLNLITTEAARYPDFRLLMRAEATELIQENGRTVGVHVRTADGPQRVRAALVVASDGRNSVLRQAAGMYPRDLGIPMDVMMFRISRRDTDPDEGLSTRIGNGRIFNIIDRNTYWQMSYETEKGGYDRLKAEGVGPLRDDLGAVVPFLADRTEEITSLDDVHLLEVRVDRLRRWHAPGLLLIGDAAHAMSPIGGFGVALAVQDAVAAANRLYTPLLEWQRVGRPVNSWELAAVQRRRWLATVLAQEVQRIVQRVTIRRVLRGGQMTGPHPEKVFQRIPILHKFFSRWIGVGLRPERVRIPLTANPQAGD
jgi:2-polyprenyl-6-methoxyphenol hydroxylase-like FAD-dependent oxidoreductase